MNSNKPATQRQFANDLTEMVHRKVEDLSRAIPPNVDVDRFVDVALTAAIQNDDLRNATIESVYLALKRCAQAGLMPDGDESAIVRYKDQAQWMPMVKGIVRLMLRSPDVAKVEARAVLKGDEFSYNYGLHPKLEHRPSGDDQDPGELGENVRAAYAIVFWKGLPPEHATFEVVPKEEIERARRTSRASTSPAWTNWYGEMARKVALHRVSKYVDLAPEAARAIKADIAAGWEADEPSPQGLSTEERLADDAQRRTSELKRRMREANGGGGEPSREPVEAESSEEDAGSETSYECAGCGREFSSQQGLAGHTASCPGRQEDGEGAEGDESRSEPADQSEEGGAPGEEDGPPEPSEEDLERGEKQRKVRHLEVISLYRKPDVMHAAEKLFGDDAPEGFGAVGELSADRLSRLSDELTENYRTSEEASSDG